MKMIENGSDAEFIEKVTGLSKEEIDEICKLKFNKNK